MEFRLVDAKLTLMYASRRSPEAVATNIRPGVRGDLAALEPMAAKNHGKGRFAYDPGFPRGKAEELFRVWIRKSVINSEAGTRDPESRERHHCLVADMDGSICGYSALKISHNDNIGQISLLGVDDSARRKGVGGDLVNASLDYFVAQGIPTIHVVTQAHNIPAQRLYQTCGFVTVGCVFVYHKWYPHG
jgi:ribosomal protein S18 acetylase RimI-like enzyme